MASTRPKWRQVIIDADIGSYYGIYTTGVVGAINKGVTSDIVVFFRVNKPGMLVVPYAEAGKDFNYEGAKKNNVKVVKGSVGGGGCIFMEAYQGILFTVAWDATKHPELPRDPERILARSLGRMADEMTTKYKIPFRFRPVNDFEVWDHRAQLFRKVAPSGGVSMGKAAGLGGGFNIFRPTKLALSALASPAEKFSDKEVKESLLRAGYLEEAGIFADRPIMPSYDEIFDELKDICLKVFGDVFGVEAGEPENWTQEEMKVFEELEKIGTSEEYILSRTPERAFKEMPTGSSLGYEFVKVKGGPLIRAYVLRKDDIIEKVMYTGTMQLAPPIALEEIERELKGCEIDEKLVSEKITGVWDRLNVMLGMGSSAVVTDVTMRACKASYENPIKSA